MNQKNILKWSLIGSIVIIANLFLNYSLSLILNSPQYDEYCTFERTSVLIDTQETCELSDFIWVQTSAYNDQKISGYCDTTTKCDKAYQNSREAYEQKVFIALVSVGVIILIGLFTVKISAVLSSALALTVVLNFIIASIRYWQYAADLLRVGILFVALVALIYVVLKKFKE